MTINKQHINEIEMYMSLLISDKDINFNIKTFVRTTYVGVTKVNFFQLHH